MGIQRFVTLAYNQVDASGIGPFGLADGLTDNAVPEGTNMVQISVTGAGISWLSTGDAPTASVGMPIAAGAAPYEFRGNFSAFQFIKQTGSPVVDVLFCKEVG